MCGCVPPSKSSAASKFTALANKFRPLNSQRLHSTSTGSLSDDTSSTSTDQNLEAARRAELAAITVLFLLPGSPKELNIPAAMRAKALSALQDSTSAAHLSAIADHVYVLLKNCSHRNFIRLGVSNGSFETVCMATSLGIVLTVAGFLCVLLLAFAPPAAYNHEHEHVHESRWRALAAWPLWSLGVGLVLSGLRGSCFFLLLFARRQPLPWEEFEDAGREDTVQRRGPMRVLGKLMIFDRKLKVKDDNLRRLQRRIVVQSVVGGVVFATLMEVLFLSLPIWH